MKLNITIKQTGLVIGFIFAVMFFLSVSPAKVSAASSCGVHTGDPDGYAGAIINVVWNRYSDNTNQQANNVSVKITTQANSSTPGNENVVRLGNGPEGVEFRTREVTFDQVSGCPFGSHGPYNGDSKNVVLGNYGTSSPVSSNTQPWALDCDMHAHPDHAQRYDITGVGTPSGARAMYAGAPAGYGWQTEDIGPPNGQTSYITVRYLEPPPKKTTKPGAEMQVSCSGVLGNIIPTNGEFKIFVQREGAPAGTWDPVTNKQAPNLSNGNFSVGYDIGDGASLFGNGRDRDFLIRVYNSNGDEVLNDTVTDGASNDCVDSGPTLSAGIDCNNVYIGGLSDPDSGSEVHYYGAIYQRNADGSRGGVKATVDGYGYGNFAVPFTADPDSNNGWIMDIGAHNIDNAGNEGAFQVIQSNVTKVGPCYTATCTVNVKNPIAGTTNGIQMNKPFVITATFTNAADASQIQSLDGTNFGVTFWQASANWGKPAGYNSTASGTTLSAGQTATFEITLQAPNSLITNQAISFYPDYIGKFGIGPSCTGSVSTGVTTYQPYFIKPEVTKNTPDPDTENPASIEYNNSATQQTGPVPGDPASTYYPGAYTTTANYALQYIKYGVGPKPNLSSGSATQAFGTNTNLGATWTNGGVTWFAGDQFCSFVEVVNGKGFYGGGAFLPTESPTAQSCRFVSDRPFERSYLGDVMAGGEVSTNAAIKGYKRGAHAGSGVEFAALAQDLITGYASAMLRDTAPVPEGGLSFANTPAGTLGFFENSRPTKDWFTETIKSTTPTTPAPVSSVNVKSDPAFNANDQYYVKPVGVLPVQIGLGATNINKHHALYVDGDVVITDNIAYGADGDPLKTGNDFDKIPYFALIVRGGNIYIQGNVTRLDGLYVAQAKAGVGGTVYTCVQNDNQGTKWTDGSQIYSNCRNQLTINGSLISKQTKFLRSNGTMRDIAITTPAVASTNDVPGIEGASWSWTGEPTGLPSGTKCLHVQETADPNWVDDNNYFCYKSSKTLRWYDGGPTLGSPTNPANCLHFRNPQEPAPDPPGHWWYDNYLCIGDSTENVSVLGLEVKWDYNACPVGKDSTPLYEVDWKAVEAGNDPWGQDPVSKNYKVHLCYNAPVAGTDGSDAVYEKIQFGSAKTAEQIRLSPEIFLARPPFAPSGSQSNGKYQSIVTLPPIL